MLGPGSKLAATVVRETTGHPCRSSSRFRSATRRACIAVLHREDRSHSHCRDARVSPGGSDSAGKTGEGFVHMRRLCTGKFIVCA